MPENLVATHFPASSAAVARVTQAPVSTPDLDGRSGWLWIRLPNGDLILGVYPQGDLYFEVEDQVARDYATAERTGEVSCVPADEEQDSVRDFTVGDEIRAKITELRDAEALFRVEVEEYVDIDQERDDEAADIYAEMADFLETIVGRVV